MGRLDYHERQEARRERLEAAAERAARESSSAFDRARAVLEHIPPGQPILVGHYSERGHRAALRRHDRAMMTGIERQRDARTYASRAAAVGSAGISQDDPGAVLELREKVARLEARRELMGNINRAWRKAGRPEPDDREGWERVARELGVELEELGPRRLRMARGREWGQGRQPVEPYELSNLGGNLRRYRQRLEALEREEARRAELEDQGAEPEVLEGNGWSLELDELDNRARFRFPARPAPEVLELLKRSGFRWSRQERAWQTHLATGRGRVAHVREALERRDRDQHPPRVEGSGGGVMPVRRRRVEVPPSPPPALASGNARATRQGTPDATMRQSRNDP